MFRLISMMKELCVLCFLVGEWGYFMGRYQLRSSSSETAGCL